MDIPPINVGARAAPVPSQAASGHSAANRSLDSSALAATERWLAHLAAAALFTMEKRVDPGDRIAYNEADNSGSIETWF